MLEFPQCGISGYLIDLVANKAPCKLQVIIFPYSHNSNDHLGEKHRIIYGLPCMQEY